MSKTGLHVQPLLIEWSPSRVRVFDALTGRSKYAPSLAECLDRSQSGREAIITVSRRSVFIRSLQVPNTSKTEIEKILGMQLEHLLPLGPGEYVTGFKLSSELTGKGRLAVVGVIKTSLLESIYDEAKTNGIRVRAVLPVAFGAWFAAKSHSLTEAAVVEVGEDSLTVDIIQKGELYYSRSVPLPETRDEVLDEVNRTFITADVAPKPILSCASPELPGDFTDAKTTLEYLSDPHAIDRQLFTFELPSKLEAQRLKAMRWRVQRAVAATVVALALGGYVYASKLAMEQKASKESASSGSLMKAAKSKHSAALDKLARVEQGNRILDVAFQPGQTFTDMVTVLASRASEKSWFTSLNLGRGRPISINGEALSDTEVTKFITEISGDPRFKEMKVVSTTKAMIGKKQVTEFLVSGKPVGNLAFDRPPKAEK